MVCPNQRFKTESGGALKIVAQPFCRRVGRTRADDQQCRAGIRQMPAFQHRQCEVIGPVHVIQKYQNRFLRRPQRSQERGQRNGNASVRELMRAFSGNMQCELRYQFRYDRRQLSRKLTQFRLQVRPERLVMTNHGEALRQNVPE